MSDTQHEGTGPVVGEDHVEPVASPPVTGHPAIDAALAGFNPGEDVHAHHDQIAAVLDVVQQALNHAQQPPLPRP